MPFDIIIPGHYFCDLIFTGLDNFPTVGAEVFGQSVAVVTGGGALNTSIALRRLGVNVGWAGVLGNDFFSQYVQNALQKEGLSDALLTRVDAPYSRVTVSLSYPNDRAFITYADQPPDIIPFVRSVIAQTAFKHLHFAGLILSEAALALIRDCKRRGMGVSMDCQHRDETLDDPLVRETLSQLDLFMPNAIEAQRLAAYDKLNDAIQILGAIVPTLVIKNGADGAIVYCDGETYHEPALRLTPLDTTGAGDCFNAGFLAAYLQGRSWSECLRWGNFCGGQSTLGVGGTKAPTLAELQAWLAS